MNKEANKNLTNKAKGRPKGSTNKTTTEIKELINKLVSNNLETLESDFNSLKPELRVKLTIEMFKYLVPTLKAVEHKETENNDFKPFVINFNS